MPAKLSNAGKRPLLRFERRLAHPPEKVWRAITDAAELKHWFPAAVEAELKPGAVIRFAFEGGPSSEGEVLAADPPREFAYTWNSDTLRWLITPDGDGCRLEFTHTFGRGEPAIARLATPRTAAGWDVCLDALDARLAGDSVAPPSAWHDRMAAYVEEFDLAGGEVVDGGKRLRFRRDLVWKPLDDVWALLQDEPGEVVFADEPDVLERTTPDGGRARWEVTRDPLDGVRVEYTRTLPSGADVPALMAETQERMDRLFARTHGVEPEPWSSERVEAARKHYAAKVPLSSQAEPGPCVGGC